MAIWRQGGFFQELAEREQHLQWFPKAYVPVTVVDGENVVKVDCCTCGTCVCCVEKKRLEDEKKKKEEAPPPPPPPPKECGCDKKTECHCHHHHHRHCCCC